VAKLFFLCKENLESRALLLLGLWCLGEFGHQLPGAQIIGPDDQSPAPISAHDIASFFLLATDAYNADNGIVLIILTA
jgi:hypothetical protein